MLPLAFGIFLVLHALVHILYAGQSWNLFQLQPGLTWPEGSWAFSKLLGGPAIRLLATVCCLLAAAGFAAGGAGVLFKQPWWRMVVVASAAFSSAIFILFWDGNSSRLDQKGAVGLLISAAILAVVLVLHWPEFEF